MFINKIIIIIIYLLEDLVSNTAGVHISLQFILRRYTTTSDGTDNNELEMMKKEKATAQFQVRWRHLPGGGG
jgi:hypothetical protein